LAALDQEQHLYLASHPRFSSRVMRTVVNRFELKEEKKDKTKSKSISHHIIALKPNILNLYENRLKNFSLPAGTHKHE
jgi:hypothetical protein